MMETDPQLLQLYRDVLPLLFDLKTNVLVPNHDTRELVRKIYFLLGLDQSVALEEAIDRIQRLLAQAQPIEVEHGEIRIPEGHGRTRWERKDLADLFARLERLTQQRKLQQDIQIVEQDIAKTLRDVVSVVQEVYRLDPAVASRTMQTALTSIRTDLQISPTNELQSDEKIQGIVIRSVQSALPKSIPGAARKKIVRLIQEETHPAKARALYDDLRELKTKLRILAPIQPSQDNPPPVLSHTLRVPPTFSPQLPEGFWSTIVNDVIARQGGIKSPVDVARLVIADLPFFSDIKQELFLFSFRALSGRPSLKNQALRKRLENLPNPSRTMRGRLLRWFWTEQHLRSLPFDDIFSAASEIAQPDSPFFTFTSATALHLGEEPTYAFRDNRWVFAENPIARIPLPLPSPFANWFKNSFSSSLIYLKRHGASSIFGAYAGAGVGSVVGGVTGAAVGGAVGAPFGPVGVAIGQFTGGALGGSTGFVIGPSLGGPTVSFFVRMWNTLWSPFGSPQIAASRGIGAAGRGLAGLGRSALGTLGPKIAQGLTGLGARMATGFAAGLSATGWGIVIAVAVVLILIVAAYFYNTNFVVPGSFVSNTSRGSLMSTRTTVTGGISVPYAGPLEDHPASQVVIKIQQSPCQDGQKNGVVSGKNQACLNWIQTNLQSDLAREIIASARLSSNDFLLQCVGMMRGLAAAFNNLIPNNGGHARQYADISTRPTNYDYIDKTTQQTMQSGDIAVWAYGEFGHTAYVVGVEREDKTQFVVAEANSCRPDCGRVGVSTRNINDVNFTGWLRKKTL